METTVKLYSLEMKSAKTYEVAGLFVLGNILFPQLCHLTHLGNMLLPIYFFTLIGAYKYGWKVGLMTAIVSPLINSMLFGMPEAVVLPVIIVKSMLLAITAGIVAHYFNKVSISLLVAIIIVYQIIGTLFEWVYIGDFYKAAIDFRMGIPGMLLEIFGGYLIIKHLIKG
ncbi:MAG: ECF transporter S component [Paludibacter sp.]